MGREKRAQAGPASSTARYRKRGGVIDRNAPLPPGLVARKAAGKVNHRTYMEIVENKDFKKKPLEFENTTQREPPALFTFVPLGNPELTTLCKDISREKGALVYIVSTPSGLTTDMAYQVNRVGYHFRSVIVEEAMDQVDLDEMHRPLLGPDGIEVIPHSQQEINEQADAALRELFPKIPNTDRGEIINHAFRKGNSSNGDTVVGLQKDLPLSRRVQLAVLAHIRHRHTRYDALLRETTWNNARRVTEEVCLDYLVKWRGDDESGRDQLDEILREVVVLSDDEDEDDGEDESSSDAERSVSKATPPRLYVPVIPESPPSPMDPAQDLAGAAVPPTMVPTEAAPKAKLSRKARKKAKKQAKKDERGFSRYGRRLAVWENAVRRMRAASEVQSPDDYTPAPAGSGSRGSPFLDPHQAPGASPMQETIDLTSPRGGPVERRAPKRALRTPPYLDARPRKTRYHQENGVVHAPNSRTYDEGPTWQPAEGQTQLQDMLHPSIEPLSPGGARFGHGLQSALYGPPETRRAHDAQVPGEVIVIREHRESPPPMAYQGQYRQEDMPMRREPVPVSYEDRVPVSYVQDRRAPPTWAPPVSTAPTLGHGHMLRADDHFEAQGADRRVPNAHTYPQDTLMTYGEPSSRGFEMDSRIAVSHRPSDRAVQYVRRVDDRQPSPSRGAFVTLREHAAPEPLRHAPRDEGFIRLREAPMMYREATPPGVYRLRERYPMAPDQRHPNGSSGALYAPAPEAEYVRRDERYMETRPAEPRQAYEHANTYTHQPTQRHIDYAAQPGPSRSQYPYPGHQAPFTPVQHHPDVIILDS